MKSYKIKYDKKAIKFIKKNKVIGIRFFKAFEDISKDPYTCNRYDIKALKGQDGFRLRIGDYRAKFIIKDNEIIIIVLNVSSRGDIYKK